MGAPASGPPGIGVRPRGAGARAAVGSRGNRPAAAPGDESGGGALLVHGGGEPWRSNLLGV